MDRIATLKSFIEADPRDFFSRHALAMEYIKLGDDQTAGSILKSILEENPDYIGSYYHLGKLLERSGESEAAARVYEQGIERARKLNDRHAMNELMSAMDMMD